MTTALDGKIDIPKAKTWQWHGSPRSCVATGSCDIAIATLPCGKKVFATHGRNLTRENAEWFAESSFYKPVETDTGLGSFELIIPDKEVEKMDLIQFPKS